MKTRRISSKEKAKILRARAEALAAEPELSRARRSLMEVIEFTLAAERYAIETAFVAEVCALDDLTPLPCTPRHVLGLVNMRGRILTVIDLKEFFNLPLPGITDLHRIIVIRAEGIEFGILADEIVGIRHVHLDALQPSLPTLAGARVDYLKGVTPERVGLMDALRIVTDPRIVVDDEVD